MTPGTISNTHNDIFGKNAIRFNRIIHLGVFCQYLLLLIPQIWLSTNLLTEQAAVGSHGHGQYGRKISKSRKHFNSFSFPSSRQSEKQKQKQLLLKSEYLSMITLGNYSLGVPFGESLLQQKQKSRPRHQSCGVQICPLLKSTFAQFHFKKVTESLICHTDSKVSKIFCLYSMVELREQCTVLIQKFKGASLVAQW